MINLNINEWWTIWLVYSCSMLFTFGFGLLLGYLIKLREDKKWIKKK